MTQMGHEEASQRPMLSARYRFDQPLRTVQAHCVYHEDGFMGCINLSSFRFGDGGSAR